MTISLRAGVSSDGAVQVNATDIIALTTTGAAAATGKTLEANSAVLTNYADDTAAAAGGIPINGLYRTASAVKVRVT